MRSPATVMVAGFISKRREDNVRSTYNLSLNKILG